VAPYLQTASALVLLRMHLHAMAVLLQQHVHSTRPGFNLNYVKASA
jgi:hypothetical protein